LTGLNDSSLSHAGLSGTTQWHNAVRARAAQAIVKPKDSAQTGIIDTGMRSITFYKNQYGPPVAACFVRWSNGLFLPIEGTVRNADERAALAEDLTLILLRRFTAQNRNVSINVNPNNYAPKLFAETPEAEAAGITSKDFKTAIERLLQRVAIVHEAFHPPGKTKNSIHYRLALKEAAV
jgi:hypothetical protein